MIISKFHFFQVKREPFFGDTMKFNNAFFGITPKALNAIDVNFAVTKMLPMVNVDMPVTTEHQSIITFEFVGVNNASAPDHFDGQIKQSLGLDVFNSLHMDTAVSLEDAEDGNLVNRPTASFAFAFASKVRFVQFNCPIHPVRGPDTMTNRLPDDLDRLEGRGITQAHLLSNPAGRDFQFKELDDPQPLLGTNFSFTDPTVTEVMEGVVTPLTSVFFTQQPVDFIAITSAAKNMPLFPAEFTQIQSGTVFTFDDELKGF